MKKDLFFLVFLPEASSSDPREAVSDWDSSSTVGGLKEAWETLEVRLASPAAPMEDTLELALLGRGGFVVTTVDDDEAVVGGSGAVATLLLMTISDTDEVMDGCISETLVLEAALAAAEAAAMAAMLEAAS